MATWAYEEEHWRWWAHMMNEALPDPKTTEPKAPEPKPVPASTTTEVVSRREMWQVYKKWNHLSNKINWMRDPTWGR
jgi:hypothetical protein